jgi:hypothetical protein
MFLPWHRLYLFHMERLLREASGDDGFTLPYWDYSHDEQELRKLPELLRHREDGKNPLFAVQRSDVKCNYHGMINLGHINSGDPVDIEATRTEKAMRQESLTNFSQELSSKPHDWVHFAVGGFYEGSCGNRVRCDASQKCGWMTTIATAGRDLTFWIHHANIDRLWNRWLRLPDRKNPSVDDFLSLAWDRGGYLKRMCALRGFGTLKTCVDQKVFTFFDPVPGGGHEKAEYTPRELVEISFKPTAEALGYIYDEEKPSPTALAAPEVVAVPEDGARALGNQALEFSVPLEVETVGALPWALHSVIDNEAGHQAVYLQIADIRLKGEGVPVGSYDIFLNLPEGVDIRDEDLWETAANYYVGALTFFGLTGHGGHGEHGEHGGHGDGEGHGLNFLTEITENLVAQKLAGTWREKPSVTFVPRGPHPDEPAIEFSGIQIFVAPAL